MSKFQEGDRVRYIGSSYVAFTEGQEYEVGGKFHGEDSGTVGILKDNSGVQNGHSIRLFELVAPTPSLPTRTVTTTRIEIVPGIYGNVLVSEEDEGRVFVRFHINDVGRKYDPSELRCIAEISNALATALEQDKA